MTDLSPSQDPSSPSFHERVIEAIRARVALADAEGTAMEFRLDEAAALIEIPQSLQLLADYEFTAMAFDYAAMKVLPHQIRLPDGCRWPPPAPPSGVWTVHGKHARYSELRSAVWVKLALD